jgi:branched-subunit amino acid transport protein AzlD
MRVNGFMIAALCLSFAMILICATLGISAYSRYLFIPALEGLTMAAIFILLQLARRNILLSICVYMCALPITLSVFGYIIYSRNIYQSFDIICVKLVHEAWKPVFLAIPVSTITWLFLRSGSRSSLLERDFYLFRKELSGLTD